jgi:hypothetical protein
MTLRRLSTDPNATVEPGFYCVPFTMANDYNREVVTRRRARMKEAPDPDLAEMIKRTWSLDRGNEAPLLLRFNDDGTYLRGPDDDDEYIASTRERYGYRLRGDIIQMQSEFGCSEMQVRIRGKSLQVSGDGKQWTTLKPANDRATRRLADMLPMSIKLQVTAEGYRMGGGSFTEAELQAAARELLAVEPNQPFDVTVLGGAHPQRGDETRLLLERLGAKYVDVLVVGQQR